MLAESNYASTHMNFQSFCVRFFRFYWSHECEKGRNKNELGTSQK